MSIQLHDDGDTILIKKNGFKGSASLEALSGKNKTEFKESFSGVFKGLTDEMYSFVAKHGKKKPTTKKKTVKKDAE
jgi:hypothetical protein